MYDFSCRDSKDMNYKLLADRTRYFKENEKGVATMCKIVEDLISEEKKEEIKTLEKEITQTV